MDGMTTVQPAFTVKLDRLTTASHGQAKRFVPHLSVAKAVGVVMSDWSWWKRSSNKNHQHQMMVEKARFLPSIVVGGIQTSK